MNETTASPSTGPQDAPAAPARTTHQPTHPAKGPGLSINWYWLAWTPFLLLAAGLYAWGFWLLFAGPPVPYAPALGMGLGGIDLVGAATVLVLAPVGIRAALDDRRQRRLEEQFPDFLTDLAANRRAGFTLSSSVRLAAEGAYGPLSLHIRRMAAQLSWNVPFEEALQRFADNVDTPLVSRSTTLVLEAERTGGYVTDVLEAVAHDAREIKHLDRERRLSMRIYTIVMYVTFLVFLGVVSVLQVQLLPSLVTAAGTGGPIGNLAATDLTLEAHRTFFYTATLVQAIGSGSMAGVMAYGRVGPGLLHAAVMTLGAVFTFSFLLV